MTITLEYQYLLMICSSQHKGLLAKKEPSRKEIAYWKDRQKNN